MDQDYIDKLHMLIKDKGNCHISLTHTPCDQCPMYIILKGQVCHTDTVMAAAKKRLIELKINKLKDIIK